jgi:hypothetical protein
MVGRRIPDDVKERLRARLLENVGGECVRERMRRMLEDRARSVIRERLRKRLLESRIGLRERIRERLRRRLLEGRASVREMLRERLRRRLLERWGGDVRSLIRERLRRRLLEGRGLGIRSMMRERMRRMLEDRARSVIRERLRRRLLENKECEVRGMLLESKASLRRRLIRKWLNSDSRIKRLVLENRERGLGGVLSEGRVDLRDKIRERIRKRLMEGRVGSISERGSVDLGERRVKMLRRRVLMLERRNEVLERELRRKTRLLKEAYKVLRRVEELGGIDKIERALRLAYDTIVKAGSKMFKEAVDELAAETGVNKRKVAELVKKVGLKEAREILKRRGGKVGGVPKTIIVEGMDSKKDQLPVLAARIVERLSKPVEAGNPADQKQFTAATLKKIS